MIIPPFQSNKLNVPLFWEFLEAESREGFGFHWACWGSLRPSGEKHVIGHHSRGRIVCLRDAGGKYLTMILFNKHKIGYNLRSFPEGKMCEIERSELPITRVKTLKAHTSWIFFIFWGVYSWRPTKCKPNRVVYYITYQDNLSSHLVHMVNTMFMNGLKHNTPSTFFFVACEKQCRFSFHWPGEQNQNRKSNYWRDCPTGIEKLSAWGLGLVRGTPMAPCIILAWGRFGNRLPISTSSTWLSHPPPSQSPPTWLLWTTSSWPQIDR